MEQLGNLWGVLVCDPVLFGTLYQHLGETDYIHFQDRKNENSFFPEQRCSKLLQNVSACLPNYTASHPIILQ